MAHEELIKLLSDPMKHTTPEGKDLRCVAKQALVERNQRVTALEDENAQLLQEKNAMLADFKELAKELIYEYSNFRICWYCAKDSTCDGDCDFEWRGPKKEG